MQNGYAAHFVGVEIFVECPKFQLSIIKSTIILCALCIMKDEMDWSLDDIPSNKKLCACIERGVEGWDNKGVRCFIDADDEIRKIMLYVVSLMLKMKLRKLILKC